MISGEFRKGHFELNVDSDGNIKYLVLNGYKILPEDADLVKLVNAYFNKIHENDRESCRKLEEIIYG